MKRTGNLFELIADRENLRLALHRALRGKRSRRDAQEFVASAGEQLDNLRNELAHGTVSVGEFRQFAIHDPKERIITAPCFQERVLHHAIINVCEPAFEKWLIADTYACRRGKGRIAALLRAREFAARSPFFLKCDIRKYFDSISHDCLVGCLRRRFKDQRLLDLFERIIRGFRGDVGRGLPIGSLTSQHFANFYLGWFDRFVAERLQVKGYVRYMDDFALWGRSPDELQGGLLRCQEFLRQELELELKPQPFINRSAHGMDFLGCRIFQRHMVLNRRSRRRFQSALRRLEQRYELGQIDEAVLQQRAIALTASTKTEGLSSWYFRDSVLKQALVGGQEGLEPGQPGR